MLLRNIAKDVDVGKQTPKYLQAGIMSSSQIFENARRKPPKILVLLKMASYNAEMLKMALGPMML